MSFEKSPAPEETSEFISKSYAGALDSVSVVTVLAAITDKTPFDVACLERNVRHLEVMLAKTFWTTENLAPLNAAVALGRQ